MKAFIAALFSCFALICLATGAQGAQASPGGDASASATGCPQGLSYPDGCANHNPNGSFYIGRGLFYGTFNSALGGWTNTTIGGAGGPSNSGIHGPNNYAQQSGQVYYQLPPWNQAGVDYPIGYDTTKTLTPALCGLQNIPNPVTGGTGTPTCPSGAVYPTTTGTTTVFCGANPTYGQTAYCQPGSYLYSLGCTNAYFVSATGTPGHAETGYYKLYCGPTPPSGYSNGYTNAATGNPAAVLQYIDFSPAANAGNCVDIRMAYNNNTIRVAMDNNKFVVGYGCADNSPAAGVITWASAPAPAYTQHYDFDFTNNEINGMSEDQVGWGDAPCKQPVFLSMQCWVLTTLVVGNQGTSTHSVTSNIMYNAFHDITGLPMSGAADYATHNIKYNYFADFDDYCNAPSAGADCGGLHGAVIADGALTAGVPINGLNYSYNTCLYPTYYSNIGTTCFSYLDAPLGNNQYLNGSIDHNVAISNTASNPASAYVAALTTKGSSVVSAALTEILRSAGIVNFTIQDNYVDATSALYCVTSLGSGFTNSALGSASIVQSAPGADIILTIGGNGMSQGAFYAQGSYPTPFVLGQYNYQNVWLVKSYAVYGAFKPYGTDGTTGKAPSGSLQNGVTFALWPQYTGLKPGAPLDVSGGHSANTYIQTLSFPGAYQSTSTNIPHGNVMMTVNFSSPGNLYPYVTIDTNDVTVPALQWTNATCNTKP